MSIPDTASAPTADDRSELNRPNTSFDLWIEALGERVNPILVKEARQALKSRQFVITFTLTLLFACGWSFLGVSLFTPSIYYAPRGVEMLTGYFFILAFPLLLIVPYAAFRSLASEIEDATFELLIVSTLHPKQIVAGKLASSALQMLVYFSVLSPCIAFTYLLRGVDILTIVFLLSSLFYLSLLLSVMSLFTATITHSRAWQIVLSIILTLVLVGALVGSCWLVHLFIYEGPGIPSYSLGFWAAASGIMLFVGNYGLLFFEGAVARIMFKSENRSTRMRRVMLVQHFFLMFVLALFWILKAPSIYLAIVVALACLHWWLLGSMLTAEDSRLSQRALRSLPQSLLGRSFFTWLNPGGTTGYVFASGSMIAFSIYAVAIVMLGRTIGGGPFRSPDAEEFIWFSIFCACYVAVFLGIGRLVIQLLEKISYVGPFTGLLVHSMIVLGMTLISLTAQYSWTPYRDSEYTWMQILNPAWTLFASLDTDIAGRYPEQLLRVVLPSLALLFLIWNLWLSVYDIRNERIEAPERVQEDDAVLKQAGSQPTHGDSGDGIQAHALD